MERNHPPDPLASRDRHRLIGDVTLERAKPVGPSRRRLVLLLALLAATIAWWAARLAEPPAPPVLPLPQPVAERVPAPALQPPVQAQAVPPPSNAGDDEPLPMAGEPPLLSDNTDLSFARRAGLHQAANPLRLTASVALALDAETGAVLYARNDLAILPIASLTKLLTAMVVLDSGVPLSQRVTIAKDDVDTLRHSRSRLRVGTTLTRREALRLALMSSENRAAHALARSHPGGLDAFVREMNAKARKLTAVNASFADPTGLTNSNRATARDVAILVAAAAKYPLLRSMSTTSTHRVVLGKRRLMYLNSNRLVRHARWPIRVQKTGYIVEAGQCLAMMMRIAGRDVVMVLLDSGSVAHRSADARKLRRWLVRHVADAGGGAKAQQGRPQAAHR